MCEKANEFICKQVLLLVKVWVKDNALFLTVTMQIRAFPLNLVTSIKNFQKTKKRSFQKSDIDQKGQLFWKNGHQKFYHPYSMPFLHVLHQNKALHNFHKTGQNPIAGCIKPLNLGLKILLFLFAPVLFCEVKFFFFCFSFPFHQCFWLCLSF